MSEGRLVEAATALQNADATAKDHRIIQDAEREVLAAARAWGRDEKQEDEQPEKTEE